MEELRDILVRMEAACVHGDLDEYHRLNMLFAVKLEAKQSDRLIWMTINYKPEVSISDIIDISSRLSKRKFMDQYWYNFEQRGESVDSIHGIHSHWLILSSHPSGQLHRDVYNTLKHVVSTKQHIDVRVYPREMLQDKLDYLQGKKWDPEKEGKVRVDKEFRKINSLDLIYTNAIQVSQNLERSHYV